MLANLVCSCKLGEEFMLRECLLSLTVRGDIVDMSASTCLIATAIAFLVALE